MWRWIALPVMFLGFCAFDYPDWVNTKQDYINLLSRPDTKDRALKEMQALSDTDDSKATQVLSGSVETKDLVSKEVDTLNPRHKRLGFKDRAEVLELIEKQK